MTSPPRPSPYSSLALVRRSAGLGTVLLSVLGFLLCAAGATGVWVGKSRLDAVTDVLFGTGDEGFEFMQARLDRVKHALDTSRQRVGRVSGLAKRLKTAGGSARAELQSVSRTLDDVFDELKSAEHGLDSVQAIARSVNKMSDSIASSRAAGSDDESAGVGARKIAELSATVTDAIARLQAMRQELIDFRDSGLLARELAAGMITRAAELDGRLANASAVIDRFQAEVSTARGSAVDLGRRVRGWTTFGAVTLMVVSLWFAISQVGLMKWGWRLARVAACGEPCRSRSTSVPTAS